MHPDDEYSLKHNGEYGKTEMWYILDCEDDSYLYYGFKKEISKEEFKKSVEENTLISKILILHTESMTMTELIKMAT